MQYTRIPSNDVKKVLLETIDHVTADVYLLDGNSNFILAHNKKYDNVCSFCGFKNGAESLIDTIIRGYRDESLDCVYDYVELKTFMLTNSVVITGTSASGKHFTVFCKINYEFDQKQINTMFTEALENPWLLECQEENDKIVKIKMETILEAINNQTLIVTDEDNIEYKIRDINVPAISWYLSNNQ